MLTAIIWILCGLLVIAFLWEVIRLAAVPLGITLIVGGVAAFALYTAAVHGHAFLCANPWAADVLLWVITPISAAVYWVTMRQRGAA